MFEYSNAEPVQRRSPLAKIAGLILFLAAILRSSFANTEKAFWACFLAWIILTVIEDFSSRRGKKARPAELPEQTAANRKAELSGRWKAFGPLATFTFVTVFLGAWPVGGLGIMLWLISRIVYDYFESSHFGKRGLNTLSLR